MNFRKATGDDSSVIAELVNSVYRGENSKKGWTTEANLLGGIRITIEKINDIFLSENNVILVVTDDGRIIGCVHLEKKGDRCELGMLSVDVNYQNKGIGRMIMDECERYAKRDFHCNEMEMKVVGQRKELVDYYLRRGYVLTGEKEPFVLNSHFGEPKRTDLYFEYMVKKL